MDWITDVAMSQAVWAILCILLTALVIRELRKDRQSTIEEMKADRKDLIDLYKESHEEAKQREQQLMDNMRIFGDSQERMVSTMGTMNNTLSMLERRMDRMEKMQYQSSMVPPLKHPVGRRPTSNEFNDEEAM